MIRLIFLCLLLAASACAGKHGSQTRSVSISAIVPETSGDVYLAGNLPELGPWRADGLLMQGEGRTRVATVRVPQGARFEFKLTQGRWEREGLGPSGTVMASSRIDVDADQDVTITIADWKHDIREYLADPAGAGVAGSLLHWADVRSQWLEETRTVSIYLPPQYDTDPQARFPVIYAHDGQNLFDPRIANTGVDWGFDTAMQALVSQGAIEPAIIVGIWSTPARRLEYAPERVLERVTGAMAAEALAAFPPQQRRADAYARFLVRELKPRIDAAFRTRAGRESTFLIGSSMGGLISLYAMAEYPDAFGGAAGLSMHWPVSIDNRLIVDRQEAWRPAIIAAFSDYLSASPLTPAQHRLWLDHGTGFLDHLYAPYQQALTGVFSRLGYGDGDRLRTRVYPGADHNETAWRARLRDPLTFLLGPRAAPSDKN
jgi:enterochelin esterase-like enzyme